METFCVYQRTKIIFEDLLLQYHHMFARHRLDIGKNDDFKVKLTPEHGDPMYTQRPPTAIHYRDEVLAELALLQYWEVITMSPYSKYSSPLFAEGKPSGKLRLLVDLRKVDHLIRHDYINHNYPIATLADVSSHFAGKKFFVMFDCSQAYHVSQIAEFCHFSCCYSIFGHVRSPCSRSKPLRWCLQIFYAQTLLLMYCCRPMILIRA